MGNQIDCKYVCEEPEIQEECFLTNSYSQQRTSPFKERNFPQEWRDFAPSQDFAKSVSLLPTMNKKVSQVYFAQTNKYEDNYMFPQFQGTKLGIFYIYSLFAYYEGEWMNKNMHGKGTLYFDNGAVLQAIFCQGLVNCPNTLFISSNGSFYKGKVYNQRPNEYGIFHSKDFVYKGEWKTHKLNRQYEQSQTILFNRNYRGMRQNEQSTQVQTITISNQPIRSSSQINYHNCTSKQKPSSVLKKIVSTKTSSQSKSNSGYFPQKHHFRKISQDFRQQNISYSEISQMGRSIKIHKLNSNHQCEKNMLKSKHKRGISYSINQI